MGSLRVTSLARIKHFYLRFCTVAAFSCLVLLACCLQLREFGRAAHSSLFVFVKVCQKAGEDDSKRRKGAVSKICKAQDQLTDRESGELSFKV